MAEWGWLLEDTGCAKATESLEQGAFGALYQQEHYKRKYCKRCPVAYECLRHAIRWAAWDGVWGGMTVAERHSFALRFHGPTATAHDAHAEHMAQL